MSEHIIDLSVADWLHRHPEQVVRVSTDTSLPDVVRILLEHGSRDAYVVDGNRVLGHLGLNRVVRHLFAQDRPEHSPRQLFARIAMAATASELMDPHFAYCREDERIAQVLHRQLQSDVSDLVVLASDDTPLGVIKLTEVVRESLQ